MIHLLLVFIVFQMMRDLDKSAQNGKRHHGHKHSHGGHTHKHGRTLSADKKNIHGSTDSIDNDANLHCWDLTLQELEMQLFFERCTSLIQLPFAARRLFDENGKEHFTLGELKRDQVVYVSCGEPWTDPRLTKAEQQRRYLLAQLSSDLAQIRQFCFLRHPEGKSINPSNAEAKFVQSTRTQRKNKTCHVGIHWLALAENF